MKTIRGLLIGLVCALIMVNFTQVNNPAGEQDLGYVPGTHLLETAWGQSGRATDGRSLDIYNSKTPLFTTREGDRRHCPLGCWTVAIANILRYHELQAQGETSYQTNLPSGLIVSQNFDEHNYIWPLIPERLDENSSLEETDMTSMFLYDVALAIGKQFPEDYRENSSFRMRWVKNHFNHLNSAVRDDENFPDSIPGETQESVDRIIHELNHFRPIMLYLEQRRSVDTCGHAMVIDGYKFNDDRSTFQVHFNFGWYGLGDGWFDFADGDRALPIASRLCLFDSLEIRCMLFFKTDNPRERKSLLVEAFKDLKTRYREIRRNIDDAVAEIENSLNGEYWNDGLHLSSNTGGAVFDHTKRAVNKLDFITGPAQKDISFLLNRLVSTDAILVKIKHYETVHQYEEGEEHPKEYDVFRSLGEESMKQAEASRGQEEYESAVSGFAGAWASFCQAIRAAHRTGDGGIVCN